VRDGAHSAGASPARRRIAGQTRSGRGRGAARRQLVKEIADIKSVDVLLPVQRGGVRTELRLRVVATPEPATAQLLGHLGMRLPTRPREIANVVPKIPN